MHYTAYNGNYLRVTFIWPSIHKVKMLTADSLTSWFLIVLVRFTEDQFVVSTSEWIVEHSNWMQVDIRV